MGRGSNCYFQIFSFEFFIFKFKFTFLFLVFENLSCVSFFKPTMDWPSTARTKPQSIHSFITRTIISAPPPPPPPPPRQPQPHLKYIATYPSISVDMAEPGELATPQPWEIPNLVLSLASSPDPNAPLLEHDLVKWFLRLPAGKRGCYIEKVRYFIHRQRTEEALRATCYCFTWSVFPDFRKSGWHLRGDWTTYFRISGNQDDTF